MKFDVFLIPTPHYAEMNINIGQVNKCVISCGLTKQILLNFRNTSVEVKLPSTSNRYDIIFAILNVKYPTSVLVWGCFSASIGRGGLYFLPKNVYMNASRYIEVLKDHLLGCISDSSFNCLHA